MLDQFGLGAAGACNQNLTYAFKCSGNGMIKLGGAIVTVMFDALIFVCIGIKLDNMGFVVVSQTTA